MARSIHPLVQLHWTDLDAYAAALSYIPVNGYVGSTYTELLRRFYRPPDGYAILFADLLPFLLEIRFNGHTIHLSTDPVHM